MNPEKTIIVITLKSMWEKARKEGQYDRSSFDKTLEEVGFIHCSFPHQTMEIANRRFTKNEDLVLLLIDPSKLNAPVKYEGARSGRAGTFPHIYGPLNTDAVYSVLALKKDENGRFIAPYGITEL